VLRKKFKAIMIKQIKKSFLALISEVSKTAEYGLIIAAQVLMTRDLSK
jgi:hypothetical protein